MNCNTSENSSSHAASSSITELLRTLRGAYSSETQANSTRQLLQVGEKILAEYDSEILALNTALSALRRKREAIQSSLTQYRSLLAPIRRLPPEILSHIFCQLGPDFLMQFSSFSSLPALAVSAVCTSWRHLALSTPKLWAHLDVDLVDLSLRLDDDDQTDDSNYPFIKNARRMRTNLRLYLERSCQAPLHLTLLVANLFTVDVKYNVSPMKALAEHAHRWHAVEIFWDYTRNEELGFDLPVPDNPFSTITHLPNLKTFQFCHDGDVHHTAYDTFTLLAHTPWLSDFSAIGLLPSPSLTLPWHQITNLTLGRVPCSEALQLVQFCQNVISLCLNYLEDDQGVISSVTVPKLKSLTIGCDFGESRVVLQDLFSCLTLPLLSSLCLKYHVDEDSFGLWPTFREGQWPHSEFSDMLSRSKCILDTLLLDHLLMKDVDILDLLHLTPSVTTLTIIESNVKRGTSITDFFLDGLTFGGEAPNDTLLSEVILPNLREIKFHVCNPLKFDPQKFARMVKSRWTPDSGNERLSSVTLDWSAEQSCKRNFDKSIAEENIAPGLAPLFELRGADLFLNLFGTVLTQ
ncbi:hypothetical protein VKT23_002803 [Stygiomarasmius scandens]|uniref:F-box domain-containing protein n=1 Tax=Marasmiellus scandens TaxID=2682957 RepID=A0ABR1K106_9AGAR